MEMLLQDLPIAVLMGLIGAIVFTLIGVVSGTDETATIAPLTLVVILIGVPPAGVFTFFMAAAISKHMTHAVPTMLLGIPGDTLAVPILEDAAKMRALGLPHLALRKAISGAVVSAFIAIPCAVLFAWILSPFGDLITAFAPWIFLIAAAGIAYSSRAKLGGVVALVPFVAFILGLQAWTGSFEVSLSISYFLGIAIGPMIVDLVTVLVPQNRSEMRRSKPSQVFLAPDVRPGDGEDADAVGRRKHAGRTFPNPFRVLDRTQVTATAATSVVSSATFVFSPVAVTVLMGEIVGARIKQGYQRLTSVITAKNGTTESTYIAETLIPLIAFGLPLSPVAAGPAAPLFNAPPVFETNPDEGVVNNIATHLTTLDFFIFALLGAVCATAIAYPFAMRYAHSAATFVVTKVSHEAIIAAFVGLVVVVSLWEGGLLGLLVVTAVGLVGGMLIRTVKLHAGVLFMGYYVAVLSVPGILAAFGG
ncbi:tripartite tricarboxylate transporter permease [Brevibacterium jeotgali]|uniref:Tripartite tricarboxylate transporter TctA family protein n=1 Tax=Brevibacterium jeotgali TaxID=1262550 RepID=A0A2H1L5G6_9MICO|nr:tripartite tricarboxylate transporter permease [Brevibacterium jeotgali]TWC01420.1 tripartite tricarboxylate transporter TctA family protein [Brevibacterium jeotgali]SMY11975.1 Tripartite tricarboxylate transporter TctA family protein [Brevibacterium jeotgali]